MSEDIKTQYDERRNDFERLRQNLVSAIEQFLVTKNIKVFAIHSRVKSFKSFADKVTQKNYKEPFTQNEDFVGLRVIVYYPDEIDLVSKIIDEEFDVHTSEDKSNTIEIDRFGYRSFHKIITIPKEWNSTPNYRGLNEYKCEIQIRTILMHAWAEIEHKLQYKNEAAVPTELRRKLFRLSAKFEEADEQFEELRNGVEKYKFGVAKELTKDPNNLEINYETLRKYLEDSFSGVQTENAESYSSLISELNSAGYSKIGDLTEPLNNTKLAYERYEAKNPPTGGSRYNSIGWVRISLCIFDKKYRDIVGHENDTYHEYEKFISK